MMPVSVDRTTRFATRPPRLMFDGTFNVRSDSGISYHPHPDGKRLVMIRRADSQSSGGVRVITNWLSELSGSSKQRGTRAESVPNERSEVRLGKVNQVRPRASDRNGAKPSGGR